MEPIAFRVRIPGSLRPMPRTEPSSSPKKVLVVMRSGTARQRIVKELKRASFVTTAESKCHDALLFCRRTATLHALITEVELPQMWGLELARVASQYHSRIACICLYAKEPPAHS